MSSSDRLAHMNMLTNVRKALIQVMQNHDAHTIAVRGTSGLSVAYELRALAMQLGDEILPFAMVRKDESHHGGPIESLNFNRMRIGSYIILDDFIASGATVNAIMAKMEYMRGPSVQCKAIVLYEQMHKDNWTLQRAEVDREFRRSNGIRQQIPLYR